VSLLGWNLDDYGEKEDSDEEDREHKREASDIFEEEKRSLQEGSGTVNSL